MTTLTPYREAVLRALAESGMSLEDESGLVAGKLRERTGHKTTQALSGVLKAMEDEGLIRRQMAGRRTFKIEATPAGEALLGSGVPAHRNGAPVVTDARTPPTGDVERVQTTMAGGDLDYDRLGQAVLKACLKVLAAKTAEKADENLSRKYLEAMREADDAQRRAGAAEAQATALRAELAEAKATIKTLEHNVKVIGAQADKSRRGSDSIKDKVSAAERRELESLMRSLPTTKG